ncbi:MAG: tetratricopeptide repeat protein [Candidatus Marinimicrobia bacterium]|nr:tetratricopeptide repeat protein [Candidatus Neomarinimicrobiota bacterium]
MRIPEQSAPSLLTPRLRKLLVAALALAAFMLANSIYLLGNRLAETLDWRYFSSDATALPLLFQSMILAHTGAGLLTVTLFLIFAATHLLKVWQRRHKASVVTGLLYVAAGLMLAVTGLFILTDAASQDNRWIWWLHVLTALLLPVGYIAHRIVSYVKPAPARFIRFAGVTGLLALLLVIWHGSTSRNINQAHRAQQGLEKQLPAGPGARDRDVTLFSNNAFVAAGYVPPASPFFPSAATTTSGGFIGASTITQPKPGMLHALKSDLDKYGFANEVLIGAATCDRCHQDIVAQWSTSAHRFASFNNPFYEATVQDLRDNADESNYWIREHSKYFPQPEGGVGRVKSKWCAGCHDPALMFSGNMDRAIDRWSLDAQAGLTCMACHAIDKIHDQTGNGNYNIADNQADPYMFSEANKGTVGAFLHDAILKSKPLVHKTQMLKPFFRESNYCATCHKVSLTLPVNNYRWLRGQNEFDNWHDSGVALNASRTFYLPAEKRVCQDCHMPPELAFRGDVSARDGTVKSHRFLAANTALPFVRGDHETIARIEAFLQFEKLGVDIFALRTPGARPLMAFAHEQTVLPAGAKVTVDVVVRNKGVGHTFPGGTNDSNEAWLEFTLRDEAGNLLAISGQVGEDGRLDPLAHVYKAVILDKDGNGIHRRNAQDIHVTVFANVIAPGTADIAHFEFVVPSGLALKKIHIQARLLWRKFDRSYTEFAYHANPLGFKAFDRVPDLPITEIARHDITLEVAATAPSSPANAELDGDWVRYNDYGIGLLLEGNTRGAAEAFAHVARLQPQSIEGPLNLAKTAVQDGNLSKATGHLNRCEQLSPGEARVAWVWGLVLQETGEYDKAAQAYLRVLEQFPEDRAAWRNLGRTYYLDQQYSAALEAFARVLAIDPEDRIAHYHRMLCFQALGRAGDAQAAREAYEYYQIDESALELTRAYRLEHPGANLMSQKIRTHRLVVELTARPSE